MIIKSVIRGGYRSAADYMKDQGKNEKTRLVELSDPSAKNLDDAFHNMWVVASSTKCTKPLHHISINPALGERLTDEQMLKIVEHAEKIYGYPLFHHQRVIVEHVKDGRQHFHVIWNRVSLVTGRPVWPGMHWKKSKQICREMEKELGLKSPTPRKGNRGGKHPHGNRPAFNKSGQSKSGFAGYVKQSHQYPQQIRRRSGSSRSVKQSHGVKHSHNVKQGRSHTSPHSNAGVLSMLNRIGRHGRKRKTSGLRFNASSPDYRGGHSGSVNNVGQGFNAENTYNPNSAPTPTPVMAPKVILFRPSPTPAPEPPSFQLERPRRGWPPAAALDWEIWGKRNPGRFFALWPELS